MRGDRPRCSGRIVRSLRRAGREMRVELSRAQSVVGIDAIHTISIERPAARRRVDLQFRPRRAARAPGAAGRR